MTQAIRTTAVTIFADRTEAEDAVRALSAAGFAADQIAIVSCEPPCAELDKTPADPSLVAAEGAGLGAAAGLSVAGLAGGTLLGLLGGGLAGGLLGVLAGLGVPEEEAIYYQSLLRAGHALVTVQSNGRYDEAIALLSRHGGREAEPPQSSAGVGVLP